jgi:hypothetical protein
VFARDASGGFAWNAQGYRARVGARGEVVLSTTPELDRPVSLSLESVAVQRGSVSIDGKSVVRSCPPAAISIESEHLVERLEMAGADLEQSWSFERLPIGNGPLTVRVRALGLGMTGSDAAGVHFRDAATGRGFVYGHGTWIDAKGKRTQVPARWHPTVVAKASASPPRGAAPAPSGEIELTVPDAVLARSVFPAALDPKISPEFSIGHVSTGPVEGEDDQPSVAFDGTNYFVVWDDGVAGGIQTKGTRIVLR